MDTREQNALDFVSTEGVEIVREALPVGDYCASHDGILDTTVIERKSIADLFNSFSSNYEAERNKIIKAKSRDLQYILAIEGSVFDVRAGHEYKKDGEIHRSKKDGISMIRQLMTITNKYSVPVWFCNGRKEMAFLIQEFFLARNRLSLQTSLPLKDKDAPVNT